MKDCFKGKLDNIKSHLQRQPRLLDRRETPMRLNGLMFAIHGYGRLRTREHMKCIKFLVDKGASVNSRDVAGNTPLHYCILRWTMDVKEDVPMEEVAYYLLQMGADIDSMNRFGYSPAFWCTNKHVHQTCLKWLLDNGANLGATDYDGVVLYDDAMSKEGSDVVIQHMATVCGQRREEALKKGALRSCNFCKKEAFGRCSGCFLVWYCSKECNTAGWANHRQDCKEMKDEYVICELSRVRYKTRVPLDEDDMNFRIYHPKIYQKPRGSTHFIVKIQAPWKPLRERDDRIPVKVPISQKFDEQDFKNLAKAHGIDDMRNLGSAMKTLDGRGELEILPLDHDMVVYNEERSIFGVITPSMDIYDELLDTIRKEGVFGVVAYFYSYWEDGVGLKINLKRVQPPETWCAPETGLIMNVHWNRG